MHGLTCGKYRAWLTTPLPVNEQDLAQRLKAQLTLFSVDEIERRIKSLEQTQQTSSLSIKEDKKIMEEIKRLSSNKPMIRQYDEAQVLAPLPMFFFVFLY